MTESDRSARRIGLYGGSFDPVHNAHVLAATYALCRAELDELVVLPVFEHPLGKALAPFDARCAMLEAAMEHLGPTTHISTLERELGGVSYTVRTAEAMARTHPDADLIWIGGADTWHQRRSWKDWERLEDLIEPFILGRPGESPVDGPAEAVVLPALSSSGVRERLARGEDIRGLVPHRVAAIIAQRDLYP